MARRRRISRKVNLRKAYDLSGYKMDYATFVRTKALPVIGEASLHSTKSRKGSRVKEYLVTNNNLLRVVKALGLDPVGLDKSKERVVNLTKKLMDNYVKADPVKGYPLTYRLPLHPVSHNSMYAAQGNRFVSTKRLLGFIESFKDLAHGILDRVEDSKLVDFSKPLEIYYRFGHREFSSSKNRKFDRANFQKAAQDCIAGFYGFDDSRVYMSHCGGEFVDDYSDGYIQFSIRNYSEDEL